MPTPDRDHLVEVLDPPTCLELIGTVALGRVGFTHDALPAIEPVSFLLHAGQVLAQTHAGSALVSGSRGAVVVFQADAFEPGTRTGWSVSVVGPSRAVTDPAELRALDALPWHPGMRWPDRCYVAVGAELVRGWRSVPASPAQETGHARPVHHGG